MSELHPLYRYGPIGFVIASALLSSALAPRAMRVLERLKVRAADLRLRRHGKPRRTLEGVSEGEVASFIGELQSSSAKRYELCLEHSEDTDETRRLVERLSVSFEGRLIELGEHVAIEAGSNEVVSGSSRWRRLSIGDRVHVTGTVAMVDDQVGGFRDSARTLRLTGDPMNPVRILYAGTPPWRRPGLVKASSTLLAAVAIWMVGSLLGLLLLALPTGETPGSVPGDHVDATLIAHAVPPISALAVKHLVSRIENNGTATRYTPLGAMETRLQEAALADPTPEDTLWRWLRFGYRSHAGKVVLGNPSSATCGPGFRAFADAVRVGGVAQLCISCAAFATDEAADAAFAIGNFSQARGAEAETIVFRQALAPIDGVPCVAGGDVVPPPDQPLCVLIHAEMKPKKRQELLSTIGKLDAFGDNWVAAIHALEGVPLPSEMRWKVPASALVSRPIPSLRDQPLAVFAELWQKKSASLPPLDAAWVGMVMAAERSAFGHHDAAIDLTSNVLNRAEAAHLLDAELVKARRLAVAIAIRADDLERARAWAEDADLAGDLGLSKELALAVDPQSRASFEPLPPVDLTNGAKLAEELQESALGANIQAEVFVRSGGPLVLRGAPEDQRSPLREWLREGFPAFRGATFFERAEVLADRLDAARSLGDQEMVSDLQPILDRFEAVVLNRMLGAALRAAALPSR